MVDRQVVARRLAALESYVTRLRPYGARPRDEFVADEQAVLAAERLLQLALQSVLDLAAHWVADRALTPAERYADLFPILERAGLLDPALAGRLREAAGLRNLLVHEYLEIDRGRIHDVLVRDLDDLTAFRRKMVEAVANEPEE